MGTACVPYPSGQLIRSELVANPALYVDGFGVAQGQSLPFWLQL